MGKTKQEKKFDRNVEISAPILDPEIIKQIHSPPKDQKRDIRHGGFKALLSDLNSQDSTDELTPITENHLPSYIGISCAVSGYSNYCSYGRKPLDQSITRSSETKSHKLTTTTSSRQAAPNRSQTNSPLAVRIEQHNIHHVTIDKSNINSVDQERKELTEKLTASAAERRLSPSPIPPTVDDRHHGAYVGARYCPMPEPSKLVNKHIPLLGIDDDLDPDEVVVEDVNKVEKKIASLYGENFVEDWKESMSHKSKKELNDERHEEKVGPVNLRESVSLKPLPPKAPQPEEPIQVDIPTPNVKVLAGVEKQFLTRLLTDENPPMPKSPSPQPTSPQKFTSPTTRTTENQDSFQTSVSPSPHKEQSTPPPVSPSQIIHATTESVPISARDEHDHFEPKEIAPTHDSTNPLESPKHSLIDDTQSHATGYTSSEPLVTFDDSPAVPESDGKDNLGHLNLINDDDDEKVLDAPHVQHADYLHESEISTNSQQDQPATLIEAAQETSALDNLADQEVQSALSSSSNKPHRSRSSSSSSSSSSSDSSQVQAKSPESQISSSTVERAPLDKHEQQQQQSGCFESNEEHIEYEIEAQSQPVNNESSPVKVPIETLDEESLPAKGVVAEDTDNLVSFSPEPGSIIELTSETNNNNFEDQIKGTEPDTATGSVEQVVDVACGGDNDDADASAAVKPDDDAPFGAGMDTIVTNEQGEQKIVSAAGGGGETTEDSKDGHYFLDLLRMEESFILERVRLAEQLLAERADGMDEERLGRIHSAIGKANLLINKKCNQFRELCEKSISGDANDQYAVLNDDLAGFWDMISIQIADVRKSLENP